MPASGRVLVDLNYRLADDELAFMVDDAGIELLIADAERLPVARRFARPGCCGEDRARRREPVAPPGVDEDALATISYTGGTTGTPKGVMLSHRNLLANAMHNLAVTGHSCEDRWLHVCPMFHVAGTSNVFAATWAGGTHVLLPRFEPRAVLETIARERITHAVFVPTMLALLLDADEGDDLSSLRHVQYAASPISPELQRRVLERFDCDVAQFYGMTEAAPTVTHLSPADHRSRPDRLGSMGAPVPGVQVEIRDAIDGVGELWVRGPNVMLGYWNRPDGAGRRLVPDRRPRARRRRRLPLHGRPRQGHDHHRRRERLLRRGRERAALAPGGASRPRSSAFPTTAGARPSTPSWCCARARRPRR